MKIILCVKQVPASSLPTDETGILDRSRGAAMGNPGDRWAMEAAARLKEALGGSVTALTMGPESARAVLQTAFSMGADRGVLMSHRAFAGADVYATGYTLAQGIRALGGADLVICGQQTTDGDTAQLPSSLGAQLGYRVYGWVKGLELPEGQLYVHQELSGGTQRALVRLPAVLAVGEGIGSPRIPSLRSQLAARSRPVEVLTPEDLEDRDPEHYGLAGSPTRVVKVRQVEHRPRREPMDLSPAQAAQMIREVCHG